MELGSTVLPCPARTRPMFCERDMPSRNSPSHRSPARR